MAQDDKLLVKVGCIDPVTCDPHVHVITVSSVSAYVLSSVSVSSVSATFVLSHHR